MPSKRTAKVVRLKTSYAIFLPKDWCRGNEIEKGSLVDLLYDGEVRVKPRPRNSPSKAEIENHKALAGRARA